MTELTTARADDGNTTTWAVHDGARATTLTIARGTPDQVTRMIEAAPSAAGFCDADTATVLVHVSNHGLADGNFVREEECPHLGRCYRDSYTGRDAYPLFQAAAAAGFDDAKVYALLADLHTKAGA